MIEPVRCQRSRVKGYKMIHPNGLGNYYVGRPGPFGNCFKLEGDVIYIDASNRRTISDPWVFVCIGDEFLVQDLFRAVVTNVFSDHIKDCLQGVMHDVKTWLKKYEDADYKTLKNKNLYCFCPITHKDGSIFPCHADVLLQIANNESME